MLTGRQPSKSSSEVDVCDNFGILTWLHVSHTFPEGYRRSQNCIEDDVRSATIYEDIRAFRGQTIPIVRFHV
jgi:hypothetical protein